jgi:hypothetical protein
MPAARFEMTDSVVAVVMSFVPPESSINLNVLQDLHQSIDWIFS